MATQGRNELCGCGRGKKYKKCCGRFTLEEMTAKLAAYAAANREKNKLIERSLKLLKACEVDGTGAYLILVSPVPQDDVVQWTFLGGSSVVHDVREAIVTRRILAGYLPMCCLVEDKFEQSGWRAVIDATLAADECRDEYVAFARQEAEIVARTLDGKMAQEDSWITAVPWGDLSYPGMPLKPRPAGTIKIEVNIPKRTITTVWELLGSMEFPLDEEGLTGNDIDDVIYEARHVIEALKKVDPPKQLVDGDTVEIWQVVLDGENKLLASVKVQVTPLLTRSEFDVLGGQNAN
jgi:SEC-C motif